jgi:hypothetical protein
MRLVRCRLFVVRLYDSRVTNRFVMILYLDGSIVELIVGKGCKSFLFCTNLLWIVYRLGLFKFKSVVKYAIKGIPFEIFLVKLDKYFEVI